MLVFLASTVACVGMQVGGLKVNAAAQESGSIHVLTPLRKKSIVKECVCAVAGTITDAAVARIDLYTTTSAAHTFEFSTPDQRKQFIEALSRTWKDDVVAGTLNLVVATRRGDTSTQSYAWDMYVAPTAQAMWSTDAGKNLLQIVNDPLSKSVRLSLTGWRRGKALMSGPRGNQWFSATITLTPGENAALVIARSAAGAKIDCDTAEIYYSIDNVADKPAAEFAAFTFHRSATETRCLTCHPRQPLSSKEACTPCHIGYTTQRFTHTPTKRNQCMSCHDSTSAAYAIIPSLGTDADLCATCHTKQKTEWAAAGMKRHAPMDAGQCLQCHSPHGTPNVFHTVAPTNTLCASCHDRKEEYLHPVSGHPHSGAAEMIRPGREMSCSACHEPHASPYGSMLRYGTGAQLCVACHPK